MIRDFCEGDVINSLPLSRRQIGPEYFYADISVTY